MKKHEKEIERVLLNHEKEVLKELEKTYRRALKETQAYTKQLTEQMQKLVQADVENKSLIQSKIYQIEYQKAMQKQINGYLNVLKDEHITTIKDYMKVMYEDSYLTNIYNLHKSGIPVTVPINQELLIKSLTYNTAKIPLSKRLYKNIEDVKKNVISEISRGISTGMSYPEIARNLKNTIGVSRRKANQIAQNEGQRVKTDARLDSMRAAKKKGADIVKVWDATLDGKTRPVHRELDQKHAEIEENFKYSGGEVFAPKQFGIAALDINCRCILLSVPRWDLEDTIQKRDNITGELIEAKDYADWKQKYTSSLEQSKYSGKNARKEIAKIDYEETKKVDNKVIEVFNKAFKGYQASKLVEGKESSSNLVITKNKDNTFKYEMSIVNTSISAYDDNVDIGNPTLANSIHERAHDIVNQLAMKRVGITDINNVTVIQNALFFKEKDKICQDVYLECFTDESYDEIKHTIEEEISKRAADSGEEFISESMVQYLGEEKYTEISKKVYNYLIRKWKDV